MSIVSTDEHGTPMVERKVIFTMLLNGSEIKVYASGEIELTAENQPFTLEQDDFILVSSILQVVHDHNTKSTHYLERAYQKIIK